MPSVVLHPVAMDSLKQTEIVLDESKAFPEIFIYYPKPKKESGFVAYAIKWRALKRAYDLGLNYVLKAYGTPQLIHAHVAYPHGYFAMKAAERLKRPLVITEHWTGYTHEDKDYSRSGFVQKYLTRRVFSAAKSCLPVSEHLGKSLKSHALISDYQVIPNVVDGELFKPGLKEAGPHAFLHVSNLRSRQKNVEAMLEVFGKLAASGAEFTLKLIGEESNEQLEQSIERFNLKDKLSLRLKLTEAEVASEMRSADTFVLFSLFENLPCVLIEAKSCGMNIISTAVGGISEFFGDDQTSKLIKAGDSEGLYRELNSVLAHKPEDSERKARHEEAMQQFGQDHISHLLYQVYQKLEK